MDAILRELTQFREDTKNRFDELAESMDSIRTSQQRCEDAVANIRVDVAVNSAKIMSLQDGRSRWLGVIGSLFVAVFVWLITLWKK